MKLGAIQFAVERIGKLKGLSKETFKYPKKYLPEDVIGNAFGIQAGKAYKVELLFNEDIAPFVKSRHWHKTATYEQKGAYLLLKMECPITPELKQWILSCGSGVEVLKPKRLRDSVMRELSATLGKYSDSAN